MAANKCCFLLLGSFILLLQTCLTAPIAEPRALKVERMTQQSTDNCRLKLQEVVKQRNVLSRLANDLIRQRNELQCNVANASAGTSSTGGWCVEAVKAYHYTDKGLIGGLKELLIGKHVASFGEGTGQYKLKLQEFVASFDAFDGTPFIENFTNGPVKHLDLSIPQFGLRIYDWVMSLEVAEHIPVEFESIFLDNIVRHAREGVILSWAVPGQVGHSHMNGRPLEYVEARMKLLCFHRNVNESVRLKNSSTLWWFRTNVNVYERQVKKDSANCEVDETMA